MLHLETRRSIEGRLRIVFCGNSVFAGVEEECLSNEVDYMIGTEQSVVFRVLMNVEFFINS
jgi:hypothetical protein